LNIKFVVKTNNVIDKLFLEFFQLRYSKIIKRASVPGVYRRAENSLFILQFYFSNCVVIITINIKNQLPERAYGRCI